MIDILSPIDKRILLEILCQNLMANFSLINALEMAKREVVKHANQMAEQLILEGKAYKIVKDFKSENPEAYRQLELDFTTETKTGVENTNPEKEYPPLKIVE